MPGWSRFWWSICLISKVERCSLGRSRRELVEINKQKSGKKDMKKIGQPKWLEAGASWKNFAKVAIPTILFGVLVGILGDALKGEQPFAHWLFHLGWIAKPYEKAFDAPDWWWGQIVFLLILCSGLGWLLYEALPKEKPIEELSVAEGLGDCQALVYCVSTSPWRLDFAANGVVWRHDKKPELAPIPCQSRCMRPCVFVMT
jgi:hypothetical protein